LTVCTVARDLLIFVEFAIIKELLHTALNTFITLNVYKKVSKRYGEHVVP
jgi:hypothetical protein